MKRPLDLWGQRGWAGQEVAGESHYGKEIRELLGAQFKREGSEVQVPVQLVPEPHNRHDRNAVSVRYGASVIGYLPRDVASEYAPVLSRLIAQGWIPQVTARVWGGEHGTYDYDRRGNLVEGTEFRGSVRLDLAEPHLLVPSNRAPDAPYAMLPSGQAIQVTGEEAHMPHLVPLLSSAGECWIYTTLYEMVEQTARTTRSVVEVRVDGAAVGKLTPKMSGELLPAIRHLAERGAQTAARAILKGNRVKADVVLYVARANQLTQAWLDGPPIVNDQLMPDALVGDPVPATTPAAVPSWRFNAPPGWPTPPPGWLPPACWRPDATWPPAPQGWEFWVATTDAATPTR